MTDGNGRAETWRPVPGAVRYEVSDKGQVRRGGHLLAQSVKNGYWQVKYTDDTGKRRDGVTVHRLVLLAFAGPPKRGQETRHGKRGQLCNWWPENLCWGSKPENEADKETPPQLPAFPCKDGCGALVTREDRRCAGCSAAAGRQVARMLAAGMNLEVAAVRLGLSSDWAYKIAAEHGGWTGTKRDARLQRPSLSQRVAITVRDRRAGGWGDASGDAA
jgi:NUMOD4 motif